MITMNDTHPAPKSTPTYRIRDEAKNAAIAVLGPLAIHEFDFVTFQLDNGRWDWDVPAAERPLSAQVIKANGGRKFLAARAASMASTPMAHIGAAKPVKLPVPPRRMAPQAQGKPAGAPDGGAGGEQPPSDETTRVMLPAEGSIPIEEGHIIGPACNGLDIDAASQAGVSFAPKRDPLDLPAFLKRNPAPAKSGIYDELKTSGALRSEPVAKPVQKPPVSRKAAKTKTAPKAAKRASKAPANTAKVPIGDAEHFGPATFKSKAALIKAAILDWKDDEVIVQEVRAAFPGCEYKASDIKWYRRKMEKAKA